MKALLFSALLLTSLSTFAQSAGTGPGNTRDLKECQIYFKESEKLALLSMDGRLSPKAQAEMLKLSFEQRDLGKACIFGPAKDSSPISFEAIASEARMHIRSCEGAKASDVINVAINQSMDARLSLRERSEMLELGMQLRDEFIASCVR